MSDQTNDLVFFRWVSFVCGLAVGALFVTVLWINWNTALEHGKFELQSALKLKPEEK